MKFAPLGDSAVVVTLGDTISDATSVMVRSLTNALAREAAVGVIDVVPAYASVTVFYDPATAGSSEIDPYERICQLVNALAGKLEHSWPDLVRQKLGEQGEAATREIEIPVCYAGEMAPDLGEVARHCRLSPAEVVERHHGATYVVQAIGFAPGFPYLGGLPESLFTPRRSTPRLLVPAGSVAIGWMQTGIYPLATPGGWQLIGRTPVPLFRPQEAEPATLRVGDRVKFRPITPAEFATWK
jgi:inhibitor of KinA